MRHQKLVIFWRLYLLDKNISLRLGQAALLQDFDIDIPFPGDPGSDQFNPPFGQITTWSKSSRVMGRLYQELFSPTALRKTDTERHTAVRSLLGQLQELEPDLVMKVCFFDLAV